MYNFVFISTPVDYYDVAYHDIIHLPNVIYIRDILDSKNPILKRCFRIHYYFKYKSKIYSPLKGIWNKFLFKNDFGNDNPLCFIFNERMLYLDNYGFIDYLRDTYPNAKFVCFLQDLVDTIHNVNIRTIIDKFDLSISYDKGDADRYRISYYPTPYSFFPVSEMHNENSSDVFFVGRAKKRLKEILAIYVELKEKGLTCDFHILDVEFKDQLYADEIHYNTLMSYEENLEHVLKTKCLLEIMQEGATGYTYRTWEAIMYNKLLLTNNIGIKQAPFYKPQYIQILSESSGLELSFINNSERKIDYGYKEKLSPKLLLEFIESKI
jgi:hypothetical protein